MGDVLLLGMTHYPPFAWTDDNMAIFHRMMLADPAVPDDARDVATWPAAQRAEWGTDEGRSTAPAHRAALEAGFDAIGGALDGFGPDVVVIFGDDQYENFREDTVPPYSVLAYDDLEVQPWRGSRFANWWGEPEDTVVTVKGRPDIGRWLAGELLSNGYDTAYAYKPLHHDGLPHAFLNTVLFLDRHRSGFPWPVVCVPINCYGSKVIGARGGFRPLGTELTPDPPSPNPSRLMDLGGAILRAFRDSPHRAAIVASASWSHAFLVDSNWRLRPDTAADRALYEAMMTKDFGRWAEVLTPDIEQAGQQEVLNWFALMGAAREAGHAPSWSTFVETWVFNSNKVFAIWDPIR
jgi:Catalytic LigB subunit of aromatic ring-opening dioxygenase